MIEALIRWIVDTIGRLGYPGIVIMMALESSFVPFPSEVVMIPAGYLASQGQMNFVVAVACGILGSWIGALVNYAMALGLGRPFLLRWGKYLFLDEKKFLRVEAFFQRHGEIGTFTGRLIPVIRQYISFPAGLARMPMGRFLFYTGLGAGIWVTILAWIGHVAGTNQELIRRYSREATLAAVIGSLVLLAGYAAVYRRRRSKERGTRPSALS